MIGVPASELKSAGDSIKDTAFADGVTGDESIQILFSYKVLEVFQFIGVRRRDRDGDRMSRVSFYGFPTWDSRDYLISDLTFTAFRCHSFCEFIIFESGQCVLACQADHFCSIVS